MVFVSAATLCFVAIMASSAQRDIQRICEETSSRQPELTFHVRYERLYYRGHADPRSSTTQYIEVSISHHTDSQLEDTLPMASSVIAGSKSPAKRLAELGAMQHLITQKESKPSVSKF